MTVPDRFRLTSQLAILKEVTIDYQGKTIDNIIQQIEAWLDEVVKQEPI